MLTYIPHIITLAFCITIILSAIVNTRMALKYTRRDLLQVLIIIALGWQVATIVFFVVNQSMWVIKSHEELVGTLSSTLWLVYDYTNKLFHLSCGLILYYYLCCRRDKKQIERSVQRYETTCPIVNTPELDEIKVQLQKIHRRGDDLEKRINATAELVDPPKPAPKR